jgi:chromosome segregation ATPase
VSLDEALEDDALADPPMALPGRHPSVEKALDGMTGDLETLKEKKEAAKEVRAELEGTMNDAAQHMNDATSIRHSMAKYETQLRIENEKLEGFKTEAGRLDKTHDELMASLKRMLEPKLMFARERFEKKDQLKSSAMDLIKQKKESYQSLLEAEAEVARAQKEGRVGPHQVRARSHKYWRAGPELSLCRDAVCS